MATTAEGDKAVPVTPLVPAMPIPSFGDIGKAANDVSIVHWLARMDDVC